MGATLAEMAGELVFIGTFMLLWLIFAVRDWQREENEKREVLQRLWATTDYWIDPEGE